MDLWLPLCKQQLDNRIPCSVASNFKYSFIGWFVSYSSLEAVDWSLYKFGGEGVNKLGKKILSLRPE